MTIRNWNIGLQYRTYSLNGVPVTSTAMDPLTSWRMSANTVILWWRQTMASTMRTFDTDRMWKRDLVFGTAFTWFIRLSALWCNLARRCLATYSSLTSVHSSTFRTLIALQCIHICMLPKNLRVLQYVTTKTRSWAVVKLYDPCKHRCSHCSVIAVDVIDVKSWCKY